MSKTKTHFKLDKALITSTTGRCCKKGTWMACDHLAAVAKEQVPLDQGPLKASCVVDVNEDGSDGSVSFDTPYAVPQHENRSYHHQNGRKAKYLEDPANDKGVQSEMKELAARGFQGEM